MAYWMGRFAISGASQFAAGIVDATSTPNGVFGVKLHWTAYPDMRRAFVDCLTPRIPAAWSMSLHDLLRERFQDVRYIWLRRLNKTAQGISHFLADRSGVWEIPKGEARGAEQVGNPVEFDFRAIDRCVRLAADYDRLWAEHFRREEIAPLEIVYEEFVQSFDPAIRRVLDYLEIDHADLRRFEPPLERMAGGKSLEWEERYQNEVQRWTALHSDRHI